jgi:hypothetical protein
VAGRAYYRAVLDRRQAVLLFIQSVASVPSDTKDVVPGA